VGGDRSTVDDAISGLRACWQLAKQHSRCTVIQQTVLPVFPDTLGSNECAYSESRAERVRRLNDRLAKVAADEGILLLDAATWAARTGLHSWFDYTLWHSAKQETNPQASALYGDLVGRLLGALRGRSGKCLVLDLDNTLWGGVVGDEGWSGITLGQGSALGEAYIAFQEYALALARRGIILAICSKNDEKNARAPFERHPDMMIRLDDIACFVANWEDKATNLRRIAKMLNIGLDALVFADDNPFERNLVRQELPMVAVPELPEDPALYASTIAAGGYFEGFAVTADDVARIRQYRDNAARVAELEATTDLPAYLRNLDMEMIWGAFDEAGLPRITQLVNKSNQYNLTTRRYNEAELRQWTQDEQVLTYQLRLRDRLGDNGMISVIIARPKAGEPDAIEIDTWLMSCRVLGRQVETAALNLMAEHARARGYTRLIGIFIPTEKNEMVRDHYLKLGFEKLQEEPPEGGAIYELRLPAYTPLDHFISVRELHDTGRDSGSPDPAVLRRL
jgi:FkbH-like protein